jgi:hypothetical protein
MDNKHEIRLQFLVEELNNNLENKDKRLLIRLMNEIIEIVELLKWNEKYNNTTPFMFVD